MKNKNYLILLLIISIIGISTGLYLKFIKSYTDEKLQIKTAKIVERQPNLGETIRYLEELEKIKATVINNENSDTLKRLKAINLISILIKTISVIIAAGATKKLLQMKSI